MGKKSRTRRDSKRNRKRRPRVENPDRPESGDHLDFPLTYYYEYDDPPDYQDDGDLIYREDDTVNMKATKWD